MKKFGWQDDLVTGVALIDDQHRQYARFVDAFARQCVKGRLVDARLRKAFAFLHAYARDHLSTEAGLMEEYDYPRRGEHLDQHARFAGWVDEARQQLEGELLTPEQLMHINYVLVDWFQEHIRSTDKQLTAYLRTVAEERNDNRLWRFIRGALGKD